MALEVARLDGSLAARCGSNMSRAEVLSIFEGFNEGTRQWGELGKEEATSVVEQFSKNKASTPACCRGRPLV